MGLVPVVRLRTVHRCFKLRSNSTSQGKDCPSESLSDYEQPVQNQCS
jgi:hypothetical protein